MTLKQKMLIREVMWCALSLLKMIAGDEVFRYESELSNAYFAWNHYVIALSGEINAELVEQEAKRETKE